MLRPSDVVALLRGFDPGADPRAAQSLERTRTLLEESRMPFSRSNFDPGHVTASGVVLGPERDRVLLVFHRRLRRWLQPGGHVEPEDRDLVAAARREVVEETGVAPNPRRAPVLIGVDLHPIPARADEPAHWHHDIVFRFVAGDDDRIAPELGRDVQWCAVDRLDDCDADDALKRSVERALATP